MIGDLGSSARSSCWRCGSGSVANFCGDREVDPFDDEASDLDSEIDLFLDAYDLRFSSCDRLWNLMEKSPIVLDTDSPPGNTRSGRGGIRHEDMHDQNFDEHEGFR